MCGITGRLNKSLYKPRLSSDYQLIQISNGMKILAIDYGEKRIGLAVGDSDSKIAFPRGIISNSAQIYKELESFCKKESIAKIVIGLPLSLSGQDSAQTKQTREFASQFGQKVNIPVELIDERLTSVQAGKMFKDRGHIDDAVAALLLEQYFRVN